MKKFSELNYDRGNQHDFITLMKELARPGELTQNAVFRFEFPKVEKPYESYVGANVKLRCVIFFVIKILLLLICEGKKEQEDIRKCFSFFN